jgi:2-(1,2-epoxy-1,2-dihydrophenyl)acetyl-CoA isomerase
LITGAGRGFCAGQDLNDRNVDPSGPAPDLGMSVERFYNPLVRRLAALPKPVICAVNGVAAGPVPRWRWAAISCWPRVRRNL